MAIDYDQLRKSPRVFRSLTGMTVAELDALVAEVLPRLTEAERARQNREGRKRSPGGGRPYGLSPRDRVLLTVIWLRHNLSRDVLGCLFGVCGTTAARAIANVLPLLEPARAHALARRRASAAPDPGGSALGLQER